MSSEVLLSNQSLRRGMTLIERERQLMAKATFVHTRYPAGPEGPGNSNDFLTRALARVLKSKSVRL